MMSISGHVNEWTQSYQAPLGVAGMEVAFGLTLDDSDTPNDLHLHRGLGSSIQDLGFPSPMKELSFPQGPTITPEASASQASPRTSPRASPSYPTRPEPQVKLPPADSNMDSQLTSHKHPKSRTYYCDEDLCIWKTIGFGSASDLLHHNRGVHAKFLDCEHCGTKFRYATELNAHQAFKCSRVKEGRPRTKVLVN